MYSVLMMCSVLFVQTFLYLFPGKESNERDCEYGATNATCDGNHEHVAARGCDLVSIAIDPPRRLVSHAHQYDNHEFFCPIIQAGHE